MASLETMVPVSEIGEGGAPEALAFRPPYDWGHLERFLADHATPGVEVVAPGRYARSFSLDGRCGTLSVHPAAGNLLVRIWCPGLREGRSAILARLRRMFDLDADPSAIAHGFARDPFVAGLAARRPGLRMPGAFDEFELAVRAILGQQVSVAAATGLAGRLVAAFGTPLTPAERGEQADLTHLFPTPEQLVEAEISRVLNIPRARGRAIRNVAAATIAATDFLSPGADLDTTVARLKALPGIGDWTAHYIAMRALGQTDALPAGDVGLMRALDLGSGRPNRAQLLDRSEAWRPWRAYAALHLWAEDAARRTG